jgi:hypothetical protein
MSFQLGELGFVYIQKRLKQTHLVNSRKDRETGEEFYYASPFGDRGKKRIEHYEYADGSQLTVVQPNELADYQDNPDWEVIYEENSRDVTMRYLAYPKARKQELRATLTFFNELGEKYPHFTSKEEAQTFCKQNVKVVDIPKPSIEENEAYTKEKATENLPKLFKVCDAFPDKLFVVALGNNYNDIREARQQLAEHWPENLLIIGEWGDEYWNNAPRGRCHGGDLYVELEPLGITTWGSSNATPVISAIASDLWRQGLTIPQIKQRILSYCDPHEYTDQYGQTVKTVVLNKEKVKID